MSTPEKHLCPICENEMHYIDYEYGSTMEYPKPCYDCIRVQSYLEPTHMMNANGESVNES